MKYLAPFNAAPRTAHPLRPALIASALGAMLATSALAADKPPATTGQPPAIAPHADEWLKRMGDYLAQAQYFSVNAEIWQDIRLSSGQQIQAGRQVDLQVRRPDRFHVEVHSTRRNRALFYDGQSITVLNRVRNFYGSIPAPATLDAALDAASEKFGITLPLEDLMVSNPYHNALNQVTAGLDLGPVTVLGVPCEHLAFTRGAVDWQIWIEADAVPVPRKIVITYNDEVGSPQYTALFSNWDFVTKLPDFLFTFEPPAGAAKIDVAEIKSAIQSHKKESK